MERHESLKHQESNLQMRLKLLEEREKQFSEYKEMECRLLREKEQNLPDT